MSDISRQVLILGNPYSGHSPTSNAAQRLVLLLEQAQFEPVVCWDRQQRDELLADPSPFRCVVVVGGDGTVREVLNAMPREHGRLPLPMTTLPAGNENLFARHLGVKGDPAQVVAAIEQMQTRSIDLGTSNGQLFAIMLTAGFDAEVVRRVAAWRQRDHAVVRVSRRSYVPHIVKTAWRYRYPRITLEADGQTFQGSHVMVFNLPRYGGPLDPAPAANDADGMLDYLVLERPGAMRLLGYAQSLMRSGVGPGIHRGQARQLRLHGDRPAPAQADGDPVGHTPLEIGVLPGALAVIDVPR